MRQATGSEERPGATRHRGAGLVLAAALALASCGGGDDADEPPDANAPSPAATIAGARPIYVVGLGGVAARLD